MMDVWDGPAVLGQLDIGVPENFKFFVYDGPLAPDKHDSVGVIHRPYFIWGHKLTATLSSGEFKT